MTTHTRMSRWFGLAGVSGVLVVASVVTLAVTSSSNPAQPQSLNEIPGFRTSTEGRIADDTITLWQAFSREEHVQDCMSQAGLDYSIDVAYPAGAMLAVTDLLGIDDNVGSVSEGVGQGGAQQGLLEDLAQQGLLEDLTTPDISPVPVAEDDQYFMTLFGESAADVALVNSTGFLPEGRNDFAQGGCVGASWDAIPILYVLRDELLPEVREEKATEMADAIPCVTPNGVRLANLADFEAAAFDSGEITQDVLKDVGSCEAALYKENAAASTRARATVFARHKQRLLQQEERYGSIVDDLIEPDEQFLQYLQGAVNGLGDEADTHSP